MNSVISGVPHIGFAYDDGYGWTTYDNVTIPWATSWIDSGFLVSWWSGPYHGYYDAEFDYAGPGSLAIVTNIASNMTLTLLFFNGHNFQAILNAWKCGFHTGERAVNVVSTAVAGPSTGLPSAKLTAGSGSLGVLYGRSNVSLLNVTTSVRNGTLTLNGRAIPYRGDEANLTLFPGAYDLVLVDGTTTLAYQNVSLTGGEYLALALGPALHVSSPTSSRSTADVGQSVRFATNVTLGLGGDSYAWSGLPSQCDRTAPSPNCTFSAAGNYSISVRVSDSNGLNATGGPFEFRVFPDPSVSAPLADRTTADVGQSIDFAARLVEIGAGSDNLIWTEESVGSGGLDCVGKGSLTSNCTAVAPGDYAVVLTVTDMNGFTANATSDSVRVSEDPSVSAPSASSSPILVGTPVTLSTTVSGGDGNYSYVWSGAGCAENSSSLSCRFTHPGSTTVRVVVTDGNGFTAAATSTFTVLSPKPGEGTESSPTLTVILETAVPALAAGGAVLFLVLRRRGRPPRRRL